MFPSLTTSNLFVEASACSRQASACQLSPTDMWTGILGPWSWMNSTEFDAASWDVSLEPLRLGGRGTMISDRITLEMNERDNVYLDYIANAIDENFTVTFPGTRNWYTLDTGFVSQVSIGESLANEITVFSQWNAWYCRLDFCKWI